MSWSERTRSVVVELDGIVGIGELEDAALEFARTAPGQLVADTVESMIAELVDEVVGPFGMPLADEQQLDAPWSCTGCGSRRGFRRRGLRPKPRKVLTRCGTVEFRSQQLECRACGRRFAPAGELLGLGMHQRRTDGLSEAAAALAVEVAYAKASRLLGELAGPAVSARTIRRDVLAMAPERIGVHLAEGETLHVPVLLLDGTGERAGTAKGGVELHLALGLVARRPRGGRVQVTARLLAATLNEPWSAMAPLLAGVAPALIVLDGEEALDTLAATTFVGVPVQRCLWHLARGTYRAARYGDRVDHDTAEAVRARLEKILTDAWDHRDPDRARDDYAALIAHCVNVGAERAAGHLADAWGSVFTYITNPDAGRLVAGHKGRPDVGTGVIERVMRELNRRSDVGVRWSIDGVRAILLVKLQRKYGHGPWSPATATTPQPSVRISLAA
mgnify:CR=1 FL=1